MSQRMKDNNQIIEIIKNTAHEYLPDAEAVEKFHY